MNMKAEIDELQVQLDNVRFEGRSLKDLTKEVPNTIRHISLCKNV